MIEGPQFGRLTQDVSISLTTHRFMVTPESDRMGDRLAGSRLMLESDARIISDISPPGSLQEPPDGQPILLMADHQTTGGYPIIGIVCSLDLSLAAQLMRGDSVSFSPISPNAARSAVRRRLAELDEGLAPVLFTSPPRRTP